MKMDESKTENVKIKGKIPTKAELEEMMENGESVDEYFGEGKMMPPRTRENMLMRVNLDLSLAYVDELDRLAKKLNISRQAVVKSFLRVALNQHYTSEAHLAELVKIEQAEAQAKREERQKARESA